MRHFNWTILNNIWIFFSIVIQSGTYEKKLWRHLFDPNRPDAHNPSERPSYNDSEPIDMGLRFVFNQLMDLDEKNQVMTTIIWVEAKWKDYHFKWDPANYGNITSLNIAISKIWKPDILLYNCADDNFDRLFGVHAIVSSDTNVLWFPPGHFKSTCNIDISWFPFDKQHCFLKFGTWSHTGAQVTFRLQCPDEKEGNLQEINMNQQKYICGNFSDLDMSEFVNNGEFNVVDKLAVRYSQYYNCCVHPYEDIKIFIVLQRRSLYYIFNLIIPCIVISGMALMVFTLPPDAGEKISLGVTILLSLTMFLQMVADKLPQTSESTPLIGIYFSCIMILCSLSIVFTVLVLNCHHMTPSKKPPKLLRVFVNYYMAKWVGLEPLLKNDDEKEDEEELDTIRKNSTGYALGFENANLFKSQDHHSVSEQVFEIPCCNKNKSKLELQYPSTIANILDLNEDFRISGMPNDNKEDNQSDTLDQFSGFESRSLQEGKSVDEMMHSYRPDISQLLSELRVITEHIRAEDEDSACSNEWKFGAKVIDRFCLIAFGIATVVLTVGIICSAPNFLESFETQKKFHMTNHTLDTARDFDFQSFKSNGVVFPFNITEMLELWEKDP